MPKHNTEVHHDLSTERIQGDTIPVPQLVFSKLGIAEEYNVRVALYVLATGITDPEKLCADLKLRSKMTAESALSLSLIHI